VYYDNGAVEHEFYFNEKGKQDGKQLNFYENGNIAIIGHYTDGKCDSSGEYFEGGNIMGISYYNKNYKYDSCKGFYENGKIE